MSISTLFVLYAPPLPAVLDPSGPVWSCLVRSRGSQGVYYEKAIRFRRWAADHVQSLVEGTYGRRMKVWGGIVDSLINNVAFESRDLHLRQEKGRRIVSRSIFSVLGLLGVGTAVSAQCFNAAGEAFVGPRHVGTPLRFSAADARMYSPFLPEARVARCDSWQGHAQK